VVGQGATPASVVWSRSSAFFFISLYMQEVLHFSALRAGAAYVPIAAIAMAGSIGGSGLVPRLGTRPIIVAGAIIATSGLYWISQIPVHGHYWTDIFHGSWGRVWYQYATDDKSSLRRLACPCSIVTSSDSSKVTGSSMWKRYIDHWPAKFGPPVSGIP
jgi:hypothetical protein